MRRLSCCLGYSLLQTFRPKGSLVMPRLSIGWPGPFRVSKGQKAHWSGSRARPNPLLSPGALLLLSQPSSTSKKPLKIRSPLTFHTLENVTHSFTSSYFYNYCYLASVQSLSVTSSFPLFQLAAIISVNIFSC